MAKSALNLSDSFLEGGELDANLVNHIYNGLIARGLSETEAMEILQGMVEDSGLDPYAQEGLLSGVGYEYNPFLDTGFYDEVDMQLDDIAQHVITGVYNPPERTADQFVSDNIKRKLQQALDTFRTTSAKERKRALSEQDEGLFRNWYDLFSRRQGVSPDPDDPENYYDYRGWWEDATEYDRANARNTYGAHLSDRYKLPGHETFSDESIYYDPSKPETTGGHWNPDGTFTKGPANPGYSDPYVFDQEDFDNRQFYMESDFGRFSDSPKGARGPWQIMPSTEADYVKSTGKSGNIYSQEYAKGVRDWYMDWLYNHPNVTMGNPTEENRRLRQVVAYNGGIGYLGNYLRKLAAQGVDIDNSTDWIEGVKPESRDYGKFIVLHQDTAKRTNKTYQDSLSRYLAQNKMRRGGRLVNRFETGGPGQGFFTDQDFVNSVNSWNTRTYGQNGQVDPATVVAYAPPISTPQGRQAARNMAANIVTGQDNTGSIPQKYSSYIHGELGGANPTSSAINNAGTDIYRGIDTVTSYMPGPLGTVNWVGHLGADALTGNYGRLAGDAMMAAAMGGAGAVGSKILGQLSKNSTRFSNALTHARDFLDDVNWNSAQRDAARNQWSRNLDAEQRWGLTPGGGYVPTDANGLVLLDNDGVFPDVNKDTIDDSLFLGYLQANNPEAYDRIVRNRRRHWNKLMGDELTADLPWEIRQQINDGTFDWDSKNLFSRYIKRYSPVDFWEYYDNWHNNAPYTGTVPQYANFSDFTQRFEPLEKARKIAYDIMDEPSALYPYAHYLDKPSRYSSAYIKRNPDVTRHLAIGVSDIPDSYLLPIPNKSMYPGNVVMPATFMIGHEVGHSHPKFNTRLRGDAIPDDISVLRESPYYGNDYSGIPKTERDALRPKTLASEHDLEANENYSDELGTKVMMALAGIHPGTKGMEYTTDHLARLSKEIGEGNILRFQHMHPDINEQLWILNNVRSGGGFLRPYKKN